MIQNARHTDSISNDNSPLWNELHKQQNLVIQAWPSPDLFSVLKQYLGEIASQDGHVAVLHDEASDNHQKLLDLGKHFLDEVFIDQNQFTRGSGLPCSIRYLINELANSDSDDWLDRLRLIVIPSGEQIFRRPYAWELFALSLVDRIRERHCSLPQIVVVIGPRRSPESAIRDILPMPSSNGRRSSAWNEIIFPSMPPRNTWWTVWTTQSSTAYRTRLSPHSREHYSGIEPVLAHFAGFWNISRSRLIPHEAVGTVDQRQAIQKDMTQAVYQEEDSGEWGTLPPCDDFVGAVTLRDNCGNPWRYLSAIASAGGQDTLINIVSKRTALQSYFLANARYFAFKPLEPLSPKKSNANEAPFDTIIQLLKRIETAGRLQVKTIFDTLVSLTSSSVAGNTIIDEFKKLVTNHLDGSIADAIKITSEYQWQADKSTFERITYLTLEEPGLLSANIEWLRKFDVSDEAGTVYRYIRADHVLQSYLPGQVCNMEGKTFRTDRVAWPEHRVFVTHDDTLAEPDYRISTVITLVTPTTDIIPRNTTPSVIDKTHGFKLETNYYLCEFKITTLGYCESFDHWATPPVKRSLNNFPDRYYRQGRVARLELYQADGTSLLSPSAAIALALWLNEAAVALFPEVCRFFIAVADVRDEHYPSTFPADTIVPRLEGNRFLDNNILIFEDSHSDLGIARAVVDNCQFILDLCNDYITWFVEENSEESRVGSVVTLENNFLPSADFFCFGSQTRDSCISLTELRETLQKIEPWFGEQSFCKRRKQGLTESHGLSLFVDTNSSDHSSCDFCGILIESGEKQVMLEDGRIRCMICAKYGVDREDQLQELYKVAKSFFIETLGVKILENIDVKLTNQADLARRSGQTFVPTSGFDPRSVGLAISNSRICDIHGKYRHEVLIESGFSPEETTATLVHELTHVWQYNFLNYEKIFREYGKLLFEGHAVLAQVEFLKHEKMQLNSKFDAERLQKNIKIIDDLIQSDNVYGQGYRLLINLVNKFDSDSDPFKWLKRNYSAP